MKLKIEVKRPGYSIAADFDEPFTDETRENITESVNRLIESIESSIISSFKVWHSPDMKLVQFLPNGSVRFSPLIQSQIDKLVVLTHAGGTRGITVQEAAHALTMSTNRVGSRFTEQKYKDFFKKIEDGRYSLSDKGVKRCQKFHEEHVKSLSEKEAEDEQ